MSAAEREISQALFGKGYPMRAHFYDHPVPDEELTKQSGRPRFRSVPYVTLKPTDPELQVKDYKSRAVKDIDKRQYAEAWQVYLDAKERIAKREPSIEALPGMTVEAHAELKALEIYNCKQLAEYEGNLAPYNHLKKLAQQILELADGIREEREPVQASQDRRQQQQERPDWASEEARSPAREYGTFKAYEEKGYTEKAGEKAGNFSVSFTY